MAKKNVMTHARDIRKEGEAWQDAVARAKIELQGHTDNDSGLQNSQKVSKKETSVPKKETKVSNKREDYPSAHDFFRRHKKKK